MFSIFSRNSATKPVSKPPIEVKVQTQPKIPIIHAEFKILLLGGAKVGKKSIVNWLSTALPIRERQFRPGISIVSVLYPDQGVTLDLRPIRTQLPSWAQAHPERVACEIKQLMVHFWIVSVEDDVSLSPNELDALYQGVDGIVYVCSHGPVQVVRPSLASIDVWLARTMALRPLTGYVPSILFANKYDTVTRQRPEHVIPTTVLSTFCQTHGIAWWKNTAVPVPPHQSETIGTSVIKPAVAALLTLIVKHKILLQFPLLESAQSRDGTQTELMESSLQHEQNESADFVVIAGATTPTALVTPEAGLPTISPEASPVFARVTSASSDSSRTSQTLTNVHSPLGKRLVTHSASDLKRGVSAFTGLASTWLERLPKEQQQQNLNEVTPAAENIDASSSVLDMHEEAFDDDEILQQSSLLETELSDAFLASSSSTLCLVNGRNNPVMFPNPNPLIIGSVLKAPYYSSHSQASEHPPGVETDL